MSRSAPAVGALALLLTVGVASAAAPTGPRLAVMKLTWNPQRVTLLTVNPNGRDPVRIAGGQKRYGPLGGNTGHGPLSGYAAPSWRSDGAELAVPGVADFFLVGAGGGGLRRVNATAAYSPVFAPDGRTVAFTRDIGLTEREQAIWTIDLVSGEQRRLTPSRRGLLYIASSFSPDGLTLLATRFDSLRGGYAEPVALRLDTGVVTRLYPDGLEPVYSPDGSEVAFFRGVGNGGVTDLFLQSASGGTPRRLTRTPNKSEFFASWDPSGERIAFARFRGYHFEWANSIVQINADGTCEKTILQRRRTVFYGPAWQPGPGREAGRIDC